MKQIPRVQLTDRGYRRFLTRHPWIYRSDVASSEPAESGRIVGVCDSRNRQVGFAFWNDHSSVALRILSRDQEPDAAWFGKRLEEAIELRKRMQPGRSMERLVHGESDGLPGLIVDRYADVLVFQTLSAGTDRLKETLIGILRDLLNPRALIERNDVAVRQLEGLPEKSGLVAGEPVRELWCEEGCRRVKVLPLTGQKTGLFLDQQENHLAAATYARGRVLDCFCYQGAFTLQVAARADGVVAVDASTDALGVLRANCEANALANVETVEGNVFDKLTELSRLHAQFDTVILDPPAFAKNRASLEGGIRGYKEINLRAMSILKPGGILITSSCSYHLSEEDFLSVLADAARDRGLSCQIIEKRTQARDHPILLSMPESYYLKCIVLRVV